LDKLIKMEALNAERGKSEFSLATALVFVALGYAEPAQAKP
jgi:hypothetical protein